MAALRRLGELRAVLHGRTDELAAEIRRTVRVAQGEGVPMAEIARQLRIDRSTLYRTYVHD